MGTNLRDGNIQSMGLILLPLVPALVAADTTASLTTAALPGLDINDEVYLEKPSLNAGLAIAGADVVAVTGGLGVRVTFINVTLGGLTPSTETYRMLWIRPSMIPGLGLPLQVNI